MQPNLNLLSYLIFFPLMVWLAVWVARTAHRHGEIWLLDLFGDVRLVKAVNDLLLVGCYALNIGYVALVVAFWEHIRELDQMLAVLSQRFALILLTLAFIHYMNISALLLWSRLTHRRTFNTQHQ